MYVCNISVCARLQSISKEEEPAKSKAEEEAAAAATAAAAKEEAAAEEEAEEEERELYGPLSAGTIYILRLRLHQLVLSACR